MCHGCLKSEHRREICFDILECRVKLTDRKEVTSTWLRKQRRPLRRPRLRRRRSKPNGHHQDRRPDYRAKLFAGTAAVASDPGLGATDSRREVLNATGAPSLFYCACRFRAARQSPKREREGLTPPRGASGGLNQPKRKRGKDEATARHPEWPQHPSSAAELPSLAAWAGWPQACVPNRI